MPEASFPARAKERAIEREREREREIVRERETWSLGAVSDNGRDVLWHVHAFVAYFS